jgi:hypothetical protein
VDVTALLTTAEKLKEKGGTRKRRRDVAESSRAKNRGVTTTTVRDPNR